MKVISLGMGQKILEGDSAVLQRQIEYGKLFDELHVVVFSNKGLNFSSRKVSDNVYVYPSNTSIRPLYFLDYFKIVSKLIKKIGNENVVITTQDPFEIGLVGVLLKMRFGLPLQVQLHTDFNNKYFILHSPLNFVRFLLAHLVLPYADAVRVVSKRVEESIKGMNENITVLPISISLGVTSVKPEVTPRGRILTVARLEKEKNLETAIKAFAKIVEKYPEATFTIAGEGSCRRSLELLAISYQLEARIKFIGWVDNLPELYSRHDIYISTSLFEGYGMSVIEAGAQGLALVLSDAGIAREIPAYICKPGDTDCFVESLDKLLSDREKVKEMGEEAKVWVEANVIENQDYLMNYKKAVERSLGRKKVGFIKALFRGNKVLRFLVGGGTAAFTQIFTLYIFTETAHLWYLYSSVMSFFVAFIVSFLMQKLWVFQDREIKGAHIQAMKYLVVGLTGALLNTLVMYVFVSVFGLWYILAQIVVGVFIAVFNFFVYKKFIFKAQ